MGRITSRETHLGGAVEVNSTLQSKARFDGEVIHPMFGRMLRNDVRRNPVLTFAVAALMAVSVAPVSYTHLTLPTKA